MKVLMVCLGNICRSPLAAAILKKKALYHKLNIQCDSAGTGAWHSGEMADARSIEIAEKNDIDLSFHRARQFQIDDFEKYDVIYAMDSNNLTDILHKARNDSDKNKVRLILDESHPGLKKSVPDPYYGGQDGFKNVYNLLNQACELIIQKNI